MEIIIISSLIIFLVFFNSLQYITGVLATPQKSVYLGTVHWASDYFSYLSQFVQGTSNWFYSYDLYTSDFPKKTLVGWINVFFGHIFNIFGIDHLLAYQLSIVIFALAYLGVSYLLILEIFKDEKYKRIIAFILFVFSNAFPKIVFAGGRINLSYYDYWYNMGVPFNRLGGIPAHLIARTCISLLLLLVLIWWKMIKKRRIPTKFIILAAFPLLGFVLASIEPVHFILLFLILVIVGLIYILKEVIKSARLQFLFWSKKNYTYFLNYIFSKKNLNKKREIRKYHLYPKHSIIFDFKESIHFLLPVILFFISGLPMVFYLKKIFWLPPYSQLYDWEKTQYLPINFFKYMLGNGPVLLLAIVGLVVIFNRVNLSRLLTIIFILLTTGLFLSPIPKMVSISNVRFLPATTTLFLACLATEAISAFANIYKKRRNTLKILTTALVILILTPSFFAQIRDRQKKDFDDISVYLPKDAYSAYKEAQKISNIEETFLVISPYNLSFPGIAGRRVYEGHMLATIDYNKKVMLTYDFFFGQESINKMQEFLLKEKIDYLLTYPWTRNINDIPVLKKIFENKLLALYKVIK